MSDTEKPNKEQFKNEEEKQMSKLISTRLETAAINYDWQRVHQHNKVSEEMLKTLE